MAKMNSFTFISLNGYYKGVDDDITWHHHGEEEAEYAQESLRSGNTLLFGRVTYEMMKNFWSTEMAFELFPKVAEGINQAQKVVCSKQMTTTDWMNTEVVIHDLLSRVRELKKNSTKDITILGSGSILSQLSDAGLIDEYQFMIDPVLVNGGTHIFDQITQNTHLQLTKIKVFDSGIILAYYQRID